ncbi:MAG: MFS transporter, partial [Bacteroidaceae bacterium]|nr:MFS transporter [Bacteroidaceae bacterium]
GTMSQKFGSAISGALVALLLGIAGMTSGTDDAGQTIVTITDDEAVRGMIWALFSLFPALIAALMLWLVYKYPLKK